MNVKGVPGGNNPHSCRKQTPKGCAHRSPSTREYELFKEFAEEGATLQKGDVYSCRKQTPKGCADRSPSIRDTNGVRRGGWEKLKGGGKGTSVCAAVLWVLPSITFARPYPLPANPNMTVDRALPHMTFCRASWVTSRPLLKQRPLTWAGRPQPLYVASRCSRRASLRLAPCFCPSDRREEARHAACGSLGPRTSVLAPTELTRALQRCSPTRPWYPPGL